MTSYVRHSACNGRKPRQLMGAHFFYRNTLLARMMFDRSRVRYLVAPTGFGKTMLMGSYVQLVADYEGVLWLNAQNPCFLRDLDSGELAAVLLECSEAGGLIVVDDTPALSVARRRVLWAMCQELVGAGREVLVATTPSANPLCAYEKSCLVLRPADFLYTTEDFDALRDMEIAARHLPAPAGLVDLIACTALRAPGSYERFLSSHIADLDSTSGAGLSFAVLVLERGTFDGLSHVLGRAVTAKDLSPQMLRPFVRTDEFRDEFDAAGFPLREVIRAFSGHVGSIADSLNMESASGMVLRLADALHAAGNAQRAAQLLIAMSIPSVRASWLKEHQQSLLECGHLVAGEALFESLRGTRYYTQSMLRVGSYLRRCILNDATCAREGMLEVARCSGASAAERILAASVALAFNAPSALVLKLAGALASIRRAGPARGGSSLEPFVMLWKHLGSRAQLSDNSIQELIGSRKAFGDQVPGSAPWHCMFASCLVGACTSGFVEEKHWQDISAFAYDVLDGNSTDAHSTVFEIVLRQALGCAPPKFPRNKPVETRSALRCKAMEASLEVQSAKYTRMTRGRADGTGGTGDAGSVRVGGDIASQMMRTNTPVLGVDVFGRFDVRLGDETLDHQSFKRTKVRVLLTLLALECGRDLSCETLSARLWPDSSPGKARHNLISTVSLLRKAIRLPGGECPYIRKSTGVVGLNQGLVRSDIADLSALCRKLRFDEPDPDLFARILEQVKQVYRGELLPGEDNEPLIVSARAVWLDKTVASLMMGARRIAPADREVALQLAQHALGLDPRREDVYEALMELQADCGQRPAAIDTWFTYCRYIDDELGLDPAPRVKDLYNRIISD